MFSKALFVYDDSISPEAITDKSDDKILYKGCSIPLETFNDMCIPEKLIVFPSFCSFFPNMNIAIKFMDMDYY